MYSWLFLMIAIFTEVIGTLAMKYSTEGWPTLGMSFMYIMLVISYSSLAIAVKKIPLAVAYGAWECIGLVLIALVSAVLFAEPLGLIKMAAIALIIGGIALLDSGTDLREVKE